MTPQFLRLCAREFRPNGDHYLQGRCRALQVAIPPGHSGPTLAFVCDEHGLGVLFFPMGMLPRLQVLEEDLVDPATRRAGSCC